MTLHPLQVVGVRVELPANQPVTLRFRWSGALVSPEGGPLATKRLAYVGPEGSYLLYASRWFPFHDYAADRATSVIPIAARTTCGYMVKLSAASTEFAGTCVNRSVARTRP